MVERPIRKGLRKEVYSLNNRPGGCVRPAGCLVTLHHYPINCIAICGKELACDNMATAD